MQLALDRLPAGVSLVDPPRPETPSRGNLVFRCSWPGGEAILKVYRRRRSVVAEAFAEVPQRFVEGKRGIGPARRRATELAALSAWRAHGFAAPAVLELDPPDWVSEPSLWMEFVEGVTLFRALGDAERTRVDRESLVTRLAEDSARRHRCALESGETLLVHEHPNARHVLVSGDRMVTFDMEHAYRPGFSVETALGYEISSTLRSLLAFGGLGDVFFDRFLGAYGEPGILRESCRRFLGASLQWRAYRRFEQARRRDRSKTAAMRRLARSLGLSALAD